MLTFFNRKGDTTAPKKQICITGILAGILRPGTPALYLEGTEKIVKLKKHHCAGHSGSCTGSCTV